MGRIGGQNVPVTCIYGDFAPKKLLSSTSMTAPLLKQVAGRLGGVTEGEGGGGSQTYEDQKKIIGGQGHGFWIL